MENNTTPKHLGRGKFLSLLGKSAVGIWIMQVLPTVPAFAQGKSARPTKTTTAKVKIHPQAVKRERG